MLATGATPEAADARKFDIHLRAKACASAVCAAAVEWHPHDGHIVVLDVADVLNEGGLQRQRQQTANGDGRSNSCMSAPVENVRWTAAGVHVFKLLNDRRQNIVVLGITDVSDERCLQRQRHQTGNSDGRYYGLGCARTLCGGQRPMFCVSGRYKN